MLSIRFQRTGRKGHAQFRIVVQDSRLTPTSGKVVARLGSYNPHTKDVILDKEKAEFYLSNGAQPSDRAVRMFKSEGVKLPSWVKDPTSKERTVRNPEKRRSTSPEPAAPEAEAPATEEAPEAETPAAEDTPVEETPATEEAPAEEAPAAPEAEAPATEEAPAGEAPAEEAPAAPEAEAPATEEAPEAEAPASEETPAEPAEDKPKDK